jgi:hypothetical protein
MLAMRRCNHVCGGTEVVWQWFGANVLQWGVLKRQLCTLNYLKELMDQPERWLANYVMLGTSNYTSRWGGTCG